MTELHDVAAHLFHMTSDETFQIRTESPLEVTVRPGEPGAPVLYVLDAAFLLEITTGVVSMLHTLAGLVAEPFPRFALVGIGYPTRDPRQLFALRARDLTPSAGDGGPIDILPPLEFGGAEGFLSTLMEELVPDIEARFEVSTERGAWSASRSVDCSGCTRCCTALRPSPTICWAVRRCGGIAGFP